MTILGIEHVGTVENHEDMVVEIEPLEILRTNSRYLVLSMQTIVYCNQKYGFENTRCHLAKRDQK